MKALILALALGAFSALGFAPLEWWPLTVIAFAGLMALVVRAKDRRGALARGWWFGLGHFIVGLNWIATAFTYQAAMPAWLGWLAVLLLSLYLAIFPAVTAGLAWRLGRRDRPAFVLIFAAAWIVTEWLRATMFTGFAWNPLAVVAMPLGDGAMMARLVGTYGLSGVILVWIGVLWVLAERQRAGMLALLALLPPVLLIGGQAWRGVATADGPAIRVVQPNIPQERKDDPDYGIFSVMQLARESGRPRGPARLLLWPEAATPYFLTEQPEARRAFAKLLGPDDILLTGGTTIEYGPDGFDAVGARNALFVMDARARLLARYDKAHLVPYGEYLPMRPILSAIGLSRLVPGDLDFWNGPGARSVAVPGFGKVGVQICYEIIFSGHVVDRADRPRFLFNPSNDAWFGAWGPPQHLAQARLRAVEEGLPVVRSTPTGISAVIDADGQVLSAIPWRTAGAIDARLPRALAPTPFARAGNLLPLLFAGILVAGAVVRARRRR